MTNDTNDNESVTKINTERSIVIELLDSEIQRVRYIVETVCYAGLTLLVCVIGIPTNVLNCVVFWRQGLRDRMNLCLFLLAAVDILFVTFMFTWQTVSAYIRFFDLSDAYYSNSGLVLAGSINAFYLTAGFINMVIAVERCICVLYPHRASTFLRTRTMAIIVVFSILFFQCCCLLYPFAYRIGIKENEDHVEYLLVPSEYYYKNKMFVYAIEHTILGTVVPMTTFVILSVSTGITVMRLKAALTWRQQTSSLPVNGHSQQVALTSMLVILSCIYIITTLPRVTRQLFLLFLDTTLVDSRSSDIFMTITAPVYVISEVYNCIDFFVYYRRSAKFRMVLHKFLCRADSRVPLSVTSEVQTLRDHEPGHRQDV